MTTGCQCTADARCPYPAPSAGGVCTEHRRQAQLTQMRHSPSATVRAAGWLLTQRRCPAQTWPGHRRARATSAFPGG
jgi:hypothetical protein